MSRMTLSLKIKNTNTADYAVAISRQGSVVARLQPLEEQTVHTWEGAPLTLTEESAAAVAAEAAGR